MKFIGFALFFIIMGYILSIFTYSSIFRYSKNNNNPNANSINSKVDKMVITQPFQDYPECIADRCPKFIQVDAIPTNKSPETAVIIPLTMTQGFGKLVLVEAGGKKIFESGGHPNIGIENVNDGNGFIMKYSSALDENMNRKDYKIRYIWKNRKFVETNQ